MVYGRLKVPDVSDLTSLRFQPSLFFGDQPVDWGWLEPLDLLSHKGLRGREDKFSNLPKTHNSLSFRLNRAMR